MRRVLPLLLVMFALIGPRTSIAEPPSLPEVPTETNSMPRAWWDSTECVYKMQADLALGIKECLDLLAVYNYDLQQSLAPLLWEFEDPTSAQGFVDVVSEITSRSPESSFFATYASIVMTIRNGITIADTGEDIYTENDQLIADLIDTLVLVQVENTTMPTITTANSQADVVLTGVAFAPPIPALLGPEANYQMNYWEKKVCRDEPYDCYRSRNAPTDAANWSQRYYPQYGGHNDMKDAERHCVWQALMTKRANSGFAKRMGDAHEQDFNQPSFEREMDLHNNIYGRDTGIAGESHSDRWMASRCKYYDDNSYLIFY